MEQPPPELLGQSPLEEIVWKLPRADGNTRRAIAVLELLVQSSLRAPVGDHDRRLGRFEPASPTDGDVSQVPGERPGGLAHDGDGGLAGGNAVTRELDVF